jgi:hypothetical protein
MQQGTTNRRDNRFADAYIEPRYLDGKYNPHPEVPYVFVHAQGDGRFDDNTLNAIDGARDSRSSKPTYWVSYVVAAVRGQDDKVKNRKVLGITPFTFGKPPYKISAVLTGNIFDTLNTVSAAHVSRALGKVTVHEVGHQLGLASPGDERGHHRDDRPNIMVTDPLPVSMDQFFFDARDIWYLRKVVDPPGRP